MAVVVVAAAEAVATEVVARNNQANTSSSNRRAPTAAQPVASKTPIATDCSLARIQTSESKQNLSHRIASHRSFC